MGEIDNLKSKLLGDYKKEALEIKNQAKVKAEDIISIANEKASVINEENKVRAERDGKDIKDRIVSRAQLNARNEILQLKQDIIQRILNLAAEKVNNMDRVQYENFVENILLNSELTGDEEVILSNKDKTRIDRSLLERVNKKLLGQGKMGNLKISEKAADMPSGFLLAKGGLEMNYSIESQIRMMQEELESDVAALLF